MEIKKSPEYSLYDTTGDVPVRSFQCHSNDTKSNPWVMCVLIAQLMTHPAIYTLPFIFSYVTIKIYHYNIPFYNCDQTL